MRLFLLVTVGLGSSASFSLAFFVAPRMCSPCARTTSALLNNAASTDNPNDAELSKVQHKFKDLQDDLLEELADQRRANVVAEDIAATMLDLAADAVALQRYKKLEELGDAQDELRHASGDRASVTNLKREAHDAAAAADLEANMVESIDDAYEDAERLRERSVAHAARTLENDALEREVETRFQELEASSRVEDAEGAIRELREYEVRLRESAVQVRQHKSAGGDLPRNGDSRDP